MARCTLLLIFFFAAQQFLVHALTPVTEGIVRIVGGTTASEGEIPWQVAIFLFGSINCGASIISENFIVTAAHCSDYPAKVYTVISGTVNIYEGGRQHNVSNIYVHEGWNPITFENDIAVWQVDPPFEWNGQTAPIGLLDQGVDTPARTLATVSGWGTTSLGGNYSDLLLKVEVPIVPQIDCDAVYVNFGGIFPSQICAGFPMGGADACQGDSGSPLFFNGTLHGISSWGDGCAAPGIPGIYTKASAYRDWINQITGV
ncbi:trypsin-1-like [Neocloeon triangulifer]|uniref:trypsin-1-like n=1 Tax=Neocloeon triangulifer TaxID=2078957 RepID=UPI00286F537B|nr:trypsin-1-like [Neocloeon triangulifer]XP_059476943.1 trypsin-1-like [Neocloeon triangulifer]